jgi:molybdenum cofactor cytidylyltransferase
VNVGAVILAAGKSKRMGKPKLNLPWGDTTVIGQVVRVLAQAGLGQIVVVTGGAHAEVEAALSGLTARVTPNPDYDEGEMTSSLQVGLSALDGETEAALVALGDQPQIQLVVVESVLAEYDRTQAPLVVPSFQMRRGHPWIIARSFWPLVSQLRPPVTLRDLLASYQDRIAYVTVDTDTIIQDLDTPDDYQRYRPAPPPGYG